MSYENVNKLKDAAKFTVGVPLGIGIGVIPFLGFPAGAFCMIGFAERSEAQPVPGEHVATFHKRAEERRLNKKRLEPLIKGMQTGIVIGWIGQVALLSTGII